ncbi:MAG: hypothetical protein NHB15_21470 [Methanosarcina barkeri]|nr:hypothetical protein [Methanosarcina sp. ERenArc_MAG2]
MEHEADMMGKMALSGGALSLEGKCSKAEVDGARPPGANGCASSARMRVTQRVEVVQAEWAYVGKIGGPYLDLTNNNDGTYTHNSTSKKFRHKSDNPLIVDPIPGLRVAFKAVKEQLEIKYGRKLTSQEWDVIADHPADAISSMRSNGIDPLDLSGPNGASCIPTSERLYALLKNGHEVQDKVQGRQREVAEVLNALAASIEADNRGIYQVVFGPQHHGFVVMVEDGMAEIAQSFASVESLAKNLANEEYTFTKPVLVQHLRNLLVDDKTADAQAALFQGSIDDNGAEPIIDMQLRWNRADFPLNIQVILQGELDKRASKLFPTKRRRGTQPSKCGSQAPSRRRRKTK